MIFISIAILSRTTNPPNTALRARPPFEGRARPRRSSRLLQNAHSPELLMQLALNLPAPR